MTYTNEDLRKLQLLQLKILLEVDRICKKYSLPYFLVGGSVLGAVRHKGFIPWDDDIDIGMLRENYEKFREICKSELNPDYFLQTKESDSYCSLPWAKLQLNGTKRMDASTTKTNTRCGIDIDIFPFDNTSKYQLMRYLHSNIGWMLRGIYGFKCGYVILNREKSMKKKIGGVICKGIATILPKPSVSKLMDRHFQHYNKRNTRYVMNLGGTYNYNKETCAKDILENLVDLEFEGNMFPVPKEFHRYLTQVYGDDYMELPPEEKRVQHAIVELNFGEYA